MELTKFISGLQTICQREAWVESVYTVVKDFIAGYGNADISTCSSLCATSLKNSYVRGRVYPFINIPIRLKEKELLGLYEFCPQLPLSDKYIYCDFIIHSIYYAANKDSASIKDLEKRAHQYLETKGYQTINFEDGMAAITIDRAILDNEQEFRQLLHTLLDEAVKIQTEIL